MKLSNKSGKFSFITLSILYLFLFRESVYLTKDKITKMEINKNRLENDIDQAQDQQNM